MTPYRNAASTRNIEAIVSNEGYLVAVDDEEHRVQRGEVYGFYTDALNVGDGNSLDVLIAVGDKDLHIVLEAQAVGAQTTPLLYENTTVSANGTQQTTSNFNRNYSDSPLTKIYKGPTITDVGDLFVARRTLSNSSRFSVASNVLDGVKRIFKANTKYLARVTADGGTVDIVLFGVFYELEAQS
jgi:hypothetical protein